MILIATKFLFKSIGYVMINREERLALNIKFKERKELEENIPHNTRELRALRHDSNVEQNSIIYKKMLAVISFVEREIPKQKARLKALTLPKIAKATGQTYDVVRHHHGLFLKCELML